MTAAKHTLTPWHMDECEDAAGFCTIRRHDGTQNGDTDGQPIATVYQPEDAEMIVCAVNAHAETLAALQWAYPRLHAAMVSEADRARVLAVIRKARGLA